MEGGDALEMQFPELLVGLAFLELVSFARPLWEAKSNDLMFVL